MSNAYTYYLCNNIITEICTTIISPAAAEMPIESIYRKMSNCNSQILLLRFLILSLFRKASCANILGVFPIEAPSHHVVFDSYMSELHRRGHNVTVYSHFPDIVSEQYKLIQISNASTVLDPSYVTMDRMYSPSVMNNYKHIFHIVRNGETYTRSRALGQLYDQPEDAYDLIVTETCNTDLYLALVERFSAPFIAWTTSPLFVWSADRMGASTHPAYIPVLMTAYGPHMNFAERAHNALLRSVAFYKYHTGSSIVSQEIASKRYKDSSNLDQLVLRTSLLFVNTYCSLWGGRPLPQNVVEVGGLHVKPPRPLEEVWTQKNKTSCNNHDIMLHCTVVIIVLLIQLFF